MPCSKVKEIGTDPARLIRKVQVMSLRRFSSILIGFSYDYENTWFPTTKLAILRLLTKVTACSFWPLFLKLNARLYLFMLNSVILIKATYCVSFSLILFVLHIYITLKHLLDRTVTFLLNKQKGNIRYDQMRQAGVACSMHRSCLQLAYHHDPA